MHSTHSLSSSTICTSKQKKLPPGTGAASVLAIRPHRFMEVVSADEVTETLKRKSEFQTLQKYNRTPDKVKNSYHHLCY